MNPTLQALLMYSDIEQLVRGIVDGSIPCDPSLRFEVTRWCLMRGQRRSRGES